MWPITSSSENKSVEVEFKFNFKVEVEFKVFKNIKEDWKNSNILLLILIIQGIFKKEVPPVITVQITTKTDDVSLSSPKSNSVSPEREVIGLLFSSEKKQKAEK